MINWKGGLALVLVLWSQAISCHFDSRSTTQTGFENPGKVWLSWGPKERNRFVYAYVEGYETGMYEACKAVSELSDKDDIIKTSHGWKSPQFSYERCRAGVGKYSNYTLDSSGEPQFHAYTDVLTEFYTKHPEYRNIPFVYLMEFLTDKQHKSADELFAMASTERMITRW